MIINCQKNMIEMKVVISNDIISNYCLYVDLKLLDIQY